MDLHEKQDLRFIIDSNFDDVYKNRSDIFDQIVEGLQEMHSNEIIHRDLKPANILWINNSHLKIIDFGLSKFYDSFTDKHTTEIGTCFYSAPEQLDGRESNGD